MLPGHDTGKGLKNGADAHAGAPLENPGGGRGRLVRCRPPAGLRRGAGPSHRHRPPRRQRLPPRTYAGSLHPGPRPGGGFYRARPGDDPGRRPDLPPRHPPGSHHGCGRALPRPRPGRRPLVCRRLQPGGGQAPGGPRTGARGRPTGLPGPLPGGQQGFPDPHPGGGNRASAGIEPRHRTGGGPLSRNQGPGLSRPGRPRPGSPAVGHPGGLRLHRALRPGLHPVLRSPQPEDLALRAGHPTPPGAVDRRGARLRSPGHGRRPGGHRRLRHRRRPRQDPHRNGPRAFRRRQCPGGTGPCRGPCGPPVHLPGR
jgi:translation initiation factor IF-2